MNQNCGPKVPPRYGSTTNRSKLTQNSGPYRYRLWLPDVIPVATRERRNREHLGIWSHDLDQNRVKPYIITIPWSGFEYLKAQITHLTVWACLHKINSQGRLICQPSSRPPNKSTPIRR